VRSKGLSCVFNFLLPSRRTMGMYLHLLSFVLLFNPSFVQSFFLSFLFNPSFVRYSTLLLNSFHLLLVSHYIAHLPPIFFLLLSLSSPYRPLPTAKLNINELRSKKKSELLQKLTELKNELATLRVAQVTGGAPSRLAKMYPAMSPLSFLCVKKTLPAPIHIYFTHSLYKCTRYSSQYIHMHFQIVYPLFAMMISNFERFNPETTDD
jgi:ribosomal protein L29